ncbi:MAG: hypothetical protein ACI4SE_07315 [Lachnospiraceae bacterium]
MHKGIRTVVVLSAVLCFLGGCAGKEKALTADTDTIILKEKGSIVGYVTGEFDESRYSYEQLQALMDSEIASYCTQTAEEAVVLDKSELTEEGILTVVMTYRSAEDYSAFNQEIFFYGTIEEAVLAGYDLRMLTMRDASDAEITVGRTELEAMPDSYILITEDPSNIRGYQKVAYIGLNDTLVNEHEVDTDDGETMHYVIFK